MSSLGYPDWQKIQQWLGSPIDQQRGFGVGAGVYDAGPFNLGSWASVVVAIKPAGGPVTVTVTQRINAGPPSLADVTTFVVQAGTTIFESVVLFGDVVSIHIAGAVGGTTFDYALYPSNTTTNAQVLANAIINVQHNDALVAAEATLDFLDSLGFAWTVADDPTNTRVKITPPAMGCALLADSLLVAPANAWSFQNIPQTYSHLLLVTEARSTALVALAVLVAQFNADVGANYDYSWVYGSSGSSSAGITALLAQTSAIIQPLTPGANAALGTFGGGVLLIPNYTQAAHMHQGLGLHAGDDATLMYGGAGSIRWRNVANPISRIDIAPNTGQLVAGSRATLYGLL